MTKEGKIGIWMDHASAHIITLSEHDVPSRNISSAGSGHSGMQNEHTTHNKEHNKDAAYYKEIAMVIAGYNDVLLFGPTDAKTELFNHLRKDHHFDKIKLVIEQADSMTDNQMRAFVRDYYQHKH